MNRRCRESSNSANPPIIISPLNIRETPGEASTPDSAGMARLTTNNRPKMATKNCARLPRRGGPNNSFLNVQPNVDPVSC